MNKNLIAVLVVVFSTSFFLPALHAEESKAEAQAPAKETPAVAEEETEFSFGTIKSINANQLVVSEYDYESNADVDVTYQVAANATFENVASLKEIAVGDSVDVDFLVENGQKKAVAITVEKPLPEDEEAALDNAPDETEGTKATKE